jgi:hypothetical protein
MLYGSTLTVVRFINEFKHNRKNCFKTIPSIENPKTTQQQFFIKHHTMKKMMMSSVYDDTTVVFDRASVR